MDERGASPPSSVGHAVAFTTVQSRGSTTLAAARWTGGIDRSGVLPSMEALRVRSSLSPLDGISARAQSARGLLDGHGIGLARCLASNDHSPVRFPVDHRVHSRLCCGYSHDVHSFAADHIRSESLRYSGLVDSVCLPVAVPVDHVPMRRCRSHGRWVHQRATRPERTSCHK